MRLLLDTHVLLWALRDPERIPASVAAIVRDPSHQLQVSAATAWEIATKHRIGKLPDAGPILLAYLDNLRQLGAVELPITSHHALVAGQLDWSHRDPFDRILAAQSVLTSSALVTGDSAFRAFPGVRVIWS